MEAELIAADIECGGCAASIEKALGRQGGVQAVTVDVVSKRIRVAFDETQISRDRIVETLTDIGFPPSAGEGAL